MERNQLFEWADQLKVLRDRKEALEAELKQVNVDIDDADWHLSNLMAESETQNFTARLICQRQIRSQRDCRIKIMDFNPTPRARCSA